MNKSVTQIERPVIQVRDNKQLKIQDNLCIEEPLQIYLQIGSESAQPLLTIMRTPGDDHHLVLGFLYNEGLIRTAREVISISSEHEDDPNRIDVHLLHQRIELPSRRFSMNASCGLCGRLLIEDIERLVPDFGDQTELAISPKTLVSLADKARVHQEIYLTTGASHAASLFTASGEFIHGSEDIGRHNAVDKLIGSMLEVEKMPLGNRILVVSGRASYELVQKAVMAGIRIMVAVGAPSSLALSLAQRFDLTLIGFLRPSSYTIYNGHWRLHQEP